MCYKVFLNRVGLHAFSELAKLETSIVASAIHQHIAINAITCDMLTMLAVSLRSTKAPTCHGTCGTPLKHIECCEMTTQNGGLHKDASLRAAACGRTLSTADHAARPASVFDVSHYKFWQVGTDCLR